MPKATLMLEANHENEAVTPEEYYGQISLVNLNRRRGQV